MEPRPGLRSGALEGLGAGSGGERFGDPAAAHDAVSGIEHRRLPGRDAIFGRGKADLRLGTIPDIPDQRDRHGLGQLPHLGRQCLART